MFKNFVLPVVHWRRLPPIFCLSVGGLCALLLTAFVLGGRSEQKTSELLHEFGTALSQLAAINSVDASISKDMVSLHAIMQEVLAQPRVIMAAVHDLDQNLLVQAGQPRLQGNTQAFSAPIPLHDSIAGHVTVTLDAGFPGETALRWSLVGTGILLFLMALLALYETRGIAWELRSVPIKTSKKPFLEEKDEPGADAVDIEGEEDTEVDDWVETALQNSDLVLATPNRRRLEQQLSGELFEELMERFNRTLTEVLALYGGVQVGSPATAGVYCIRFTSSESASEAAFRAVCCAHLIYQMNLAQKIRLQVVAEVCHPDYDVKLAISDTGIFVQSALVDSLLQARLELNVADTERYLLQGFKAPYASLLARQQQQLLAS